MFLRGIRLLPPLAGIMQTWMTAPHTYGFYQQMTVEMFLHSIRKFSICHRRL